MIQLQVKRARIRGSDDIRAIKIIDKRLIGDIDDVLRFTREFAILNTLNHKNIIQLHEVLMCVCVYVCACARMC
jgi:serine/threonine protein kinase